MNRYRTTFGVKHALNGQYRNEPITIACSNADYFFYRLLTFGRERGILDPISSLVAEVTFFYNGYSWIDTKGTEA